jgi:IclR family KDG regulon transcriptional repressor
MLEASIAIIKLLGESPYEYTLTEIARQTGIGKSRAYKILSTLCEESIVVKNPSTKTYHVGPVVFRLGSVYSELKGIWEIAKPIIREIADVTKQSVYIGIWEGTQAFMAYKIDGSEDFTLYKGLTGKKTQIHAGVAGKVLAAYQDPHVIEAILDSHDLLAQTPYTITDRKQIQREFEKIRKQGYAVSDEEHTMGIYAIGVPIFDRNGQVWCCLCMGGRKQFFTEENIRMWIIYLKNGAEEISHKLGFRR